MVEAEEETEIKMPRPCKRRRIRSRPNSSYFKPAGIRKVELEEVILESDEFEAINLIDVKMTSQQEAAEKILKILSMDPKEGNIMSEEARISSYYFTPTRFARQVLEHLKLISIPDSYKARS